jgi:hypothetical protein
LLFGGLASFAQERRLTSVAVTRYRFLPAVVFCACLSVMAACSDSSSPDGPTSAAGSSTAASSSAGAAGDGSAGGASSGDASGGQNVVGDKALCRTLNTAAKDLRGGIADAQQADGGVRAADAKNTFTKFHTTVTEALAFAEVSEVTTAAKAIADELGTAAQATDPIGTAADSDFTKLGEDLTAACKTAGVTVMF